MTRIDRRIAGGEQRDQRGLRPFQIEGRLVVAVRSDVDDVVVPGLPRILAELVLALLHQQIERAFHVGGGERFTVMPFHAGAQLEDQLRLIFAQRPALGEFGKDRIDRILRLVLIVDDEIVEKPHERNVRREGRFLVDRGARRTVAMVDFQDAAVFRILGMERRGEESASSNDACRSEPAPHVVHCILRFPALVAPQGRPAGWLRG